MSTATHAKKKPKDLKPIREKKTPKFRWTERSERAVELLAEGRQKKEVAKLVGANRRAIYQWLDHPEFAERYEKAARSLVAEAAGRRVLQTARWTDRAADAVDRAFDALEKSVKEEGIEDPSLRGGVKVWGAEYRSWREQERLELGQTTSSTPAGGLTIHGNVNVTNQQIGIREFLLTRVESGLLKPRSAHESDDVGVLVGDLLDQALAEDPGIIDAIHEDDRREEEEA